MKRLSTSVMLISVSELLTAQTSQELFGKRQLVKWVKNGKEKDIIRSFKTGIPGI